MPRRAEPAAFGAMGGAKALTGAVWAVQLPAIESLSPSNYALSKASCCGASDACSAPVQTGTATHLSTHPPA